MKNYQLILFLLVMVCGQDLIAQSTTDVLRKMPLSIGETIEFQSAVLNENRVLNIYLPASYSNDSTTAYPVIYLLDGSLDEDFVHIAGIVQFGSFSWIKMLPESIVVGISNIDRKRDFTYPSKIPIDKKEFPTSGGAEQFIAFLEKEVQPLIKAQYKTTASQTLIGQSLGGLLATELLFKKNNLFDRYIIVSPSLWWDDESLLKQEMKPLENTTAVYVAVGKEGAVMERLAKDLFDRLKEANPEHPALYFDFLEKQKHGDALHLAVYHAFEKLFKQPEKK